MVASARGVTKELWGRKSPGAESLWGRLITAGNVEWLRGTIKSPKNITSTFSNTVHLLPKDLSLWTWGRQACFLPRASSYLVTQLAIAKSLNCLTLRNSYGVLHVVRTECTFNNVLFRQEEQCKLIHKCQRGWESTSWRTEKYADESCTQTVLFKVIWETKIVSKIQTVTRCRPTSPSKYAETLFYYHLGIQVK